MFREDRLGKDNKTRGMIYALLGAFCVVASFWFIFFSKYFDVRDYDVGKLTVLSREAVVGEVDAFFAQPKHWPWGNRNIFLLDSEGLQKFLEDRFFVESIAVDKTYPNILRLKIKERQRSVVLITKNEFYVVDDYGVVTDVADSATVSTTRLYLTSTVPVDSPKEIYVIMPTSDYLQKGQEFVGAAQVRGWLDLGAKLRDAGIWFKALEPQYATSTMVQVILKENARVRIDLNDQLDGQVETLRQFILAKPKWEDIKEYIDVRIPGRIYYK
jgi:hypothetical protein